MRTTRPAAARALRATVLIVAALAGAAACARREARLPPPIPAVDGTPTVAYSMRQLDVAAGTGPLAEARKCIYAHYTGWLTDGTKFDSSRDTTSTGAPRTPLAFPQGARRVIPGWDAGFEGMRVGARRRLVIPYQLAYGELGRAPRIPPKATLVFDVELMGVADTLATRTDSLPPRTPATAAPQCAPWTSLPAASTAR